MGDLNIQVQRKPKACFDDEQYNEYLLTADDLGIKSIENPVTEEELLKKDFVTPDDIIRLRMYTENYLCPVSANIYGIEFVRYAVRDFEKGVMLFELKTYEDADLSYEEEIPEADNDLLVHNHDIQRSNADILGAISANDIDHQQNEGTFDQSRSIDFSYKKMNNSNIFTHWPSSGQSETKDRCLNEISGIFDCFQKAQQDSDTAMASRIKESTTTNCNLRTNFTENKKDDRVDEKDKRNVNDANSKQKERLLSENINCLNFSGEDGNSNFLGDWVIISHENLERDICLGSFQNEILEDVYLYSSQGPQFISDRRVCYHLSPEILQMSAIGATVEFKVGNQEIKNLRMIELHFFKDKLIKMFDFDFGFCIPNSLNSWEHIYQLPKLPTTMVAEMVNSPFETKSETFYFVEGKLVIHNKADYAYNEGSESEWD